MLSSHSKGIPVHLPNPRTRLVGRLRDIERVTDILRQDQSSILTLTGPGGSGKTRLAIASAAGVTDCFPDGIWFVALAPVNDPAFVIQTIGTTLHIMEGTAGSLPARIQAAIGQKRMLLVLDNFEHVIDAATEIADLVETCPHLRVLATSRISLHLYGEREYPVPPLPVSGLDGHSLSYSGGEAIELFVERVRDIQPDFEVTATNAGVIVEICRHLDGLPLALELAAARTRHLPLAVIAQRLDHGLDLLAGTTRDAPTRQQTLRNTIAWSYNLLAPEEQMCFQGLGVFRGGWSLDAAIHVLGGIVNEIPAALDGLIDHNLVRIQGTSNGTARYVMLETIREFAVERLEALDLVGHVRERHASYFASLVDNASQLMDTSEHARWIDVLDLEYDNLRAALTWLLESRSTERGLLMTGRLSPFWFSQRSPTEGRAQIQAFLDLPETDTISEGRALALVGLSWLAFSQGDAAAALSSASEALDIVRRMGLRELEVRALQVLGIATAMRGDIGLSACIFRDVIALAREVDDKLSLIRALNNLSVTLDDAEAIPLLEEALHIARHIDAPGTIALVLSNLASSKVALFQPSDETQAMANESLQIYQQLNDKWGLCGGLGKHMLVALQRGQIRRAARLAGACATLRDQVGIAVQSLTLAEDERAIASMRAVLKDEFQAEWNEGAMMSVGEAVQLALEPYDVPESEPAAGNPLSARETEVLALLAGGLSNREIADFLFISPHTAAHHVTSILNKLGLDSRTAAATWAVRHGFA